MTRVAFTKPICHQIGSKLLERKSSLEQELELSYQAIREQFNKSCLNSEVLFIQTEQDEMIEVQNTEYLSQTEEDKNFSIYLQKYFETSYDL